MSRATYPLKLPASIKAAAERLAKEDGVSLNQWIATAVAHKVGAVETAAGFFRTRSANSDPRDLHELLARAPDIPAEPGDEVPPDLARRLARIRSSSSSPAQKKPRLRSSRGR